MNKYYRIGTDEKGHVYIECKICGMKSYSEEDIRFRFCGNCHEFLDLKEIQDIMEEKE